MPSINSFQLIGGILKAPDRCRQRELELFPLWLYLVEMYHADSQIIVGTIVQRVIGEVLSYDPVGIVFAHNSMGNIHSIQYSVFSLSLWKIMSQVFNDHEIQSPGS